MSPFENLTVAKKANIKIGDHVRVVDAGGSDVGKYGDTGVVVEITTTPGSSYRATRTLTRPFCIALDRDTNGMRAWVDAVELLPSWYTAVESISYGAPDPITRRRDDPGYNVAVSRAEEAEKELAKWLDTCRAGKCVSLSELKVDNQNRKNTVTAYEKELAQNISKSAVEMGKVLIERDALKKELVRIQDVEWPKTIADRDELKKCLDETKRWLGVYKAAKAALESQLAVAEQRAKKAEQSLLLNTDFHKQDRDAKLTQLKEMLAKEMLTKEPDPNRFYIQCGPKAVVPRWARAVNKNTHFGMKCASCKNAKRMRAILDEPYGCGKSFRCIDCFDTEKGFDYRYHLYVPRTTRAAHNAASLAGQSKAARKESKNWKEMLDAATILISESNLKGIEAVAKTVEKDNGILAANDARWGNLVKRLEEKVAQSVPLANAIHAEITTEQVESENWKIGGDGWRTKMCQVLRVRLPDGMITDPKDVVLYKKDTKETKQP